MNKKDNIPIYGVTMGSFFCTWPSIYQYQLFLFWKSKSRFLYFCSCIISILFSYVVAKLCMELLLPMLFDGKSNFFIDNGAFNLVISIFGFCSPFGIRNLLEKEGQENPYIDSDTYVADLCLTKRKIQFDRSFVKQYHYEILSSAKKFRLSAELLKTVIELERINRGSWYNRLIERVAVKFFAEYIIRKNATIGEAQISIMEAHSFFRKAPKLYLSEMLRPEISIDLCAFKLRELLDKYPQSCDIIYFSDYEDIYFELDDDMKLSIYIATEYTCGKKLSLRKFVLVYATVINETKPYSCLIDDESNG